MLQQQQIVFVCVYPHSCFQMQNCSTYSMQKCQTWGTSWEGKWNGNCFWWIIRYRHTNVYTKFMHMNVQFQQLYFPFLFIALRKILLIFLPNCEFQITLQLFLVFVLLPFTNIFILFVFFFHHIPSFSITYYLQII